MVDISSIGSKAPLVRPVQVEDVQPSAEAAVGAALYALSFANGETAQALGLVAPKNFGDVEAVFAEIAAMLDLQVADQETDEGLNAVEAQRSEAMLLGVLIQNLSGNLSAIEKLLSDAESDFSIGGIFGGDLFGSINDADLLASVSPLAASVLAATGLSLSTLNKVADIRSDTVFDAEEQGIETQKNERTQATLDEQVDDPAAVEEMLRYRDVVRDRLEESGLDPTAANRVAGVGAALQAGLQVALAALERLTGDASLFSAAVGAPQGNERVKVAL